MLLKAEKNKSLPASYSDMEVGQLIPGVVPTMKSYGVFHPYGLLELQQNSPRPHQVVTAPSYFSFYYIIHPHQVLLLPFIFIFTILILLDLVVTAPIYLILLYTYVSYTRYLADFFIDNPSAVLDIGQTLVCKVMEKKDEDQGQDREHH